MPPLPNFVIPAVPTMEVRKEIQVVDVSSFNFKTRISRWFDSTNDVINVESSKDSLSADIILNFKINLIQCNILRSIRYKLQSGRQY